MKTIFEQLREEPNINEVFRQLGGKPVKAETCENCGEVAEKCDCDNEFNIQ